MKLIKALVVLILTPFTLSNVLYSQSLDPDLNRYYLEETDSLLIARVGKANFDKYFCFEQLSAHSKIAGEIRPVNTLGSKILTHIFVLYRLNIPELKYTTTFLYIHQPDVGNRTIKDSADIPPFILAGQAINMLDTGQVNSILSENFPVTSFITRELVFTTVNGKFIWNVVDVYPSETDQNKRMYNQYVVDAISGEILDKQEARELLRMGCRGGFSQISKMSARRYKRELRKVNKEL